MSEEDKTIEDRAYEALIAFVLRPGSEELTMEEVHKFMVEYDAGLHQLSDEDKAALERVKLKWRANHMDERPSHREVP